MNSPRFSGPDAAGSELRATVATIEHEFSRLSGQATDKGSKTRRFFSLGVLAGSTTTVSRSGAARSTDDGCDDCRLFPDFLPFQLSLPSWICLPGGFFSDPKVFAGIGVLLLLQGSFIYLPFMQNVFGTASLDAVALSRAAVVAIFVLPLIGIEKALRNRSIVENGTHERLLIPKKTSTPLI